MQSFFKPIIEKCDGCERIIAEDNERFCKTYANPEAKWRNGFCNFAKSQNQSLEGFEKGFRQMTYILITLLSILPN
jgi:hypothetical protein